MKPLTWRVRGVFGGPVGTQGVMQCSLREFADSGATQDFVKYDCVFGLYLRGQRHNNANHLFL